MRRSVLLVLALAAPAAAQLFVPTVNPPVRLVHAARPTAPLSRFLPGFLTEDPAWTLAPEQLAPGSLARLDQETGQWPFIFRGSPNRAFFQVSVPPLTLRSGDGRRWPLTPVAQSFTSFSSQPGYWSSLTDAASFLVARAFVSGALFPGNHIQIPDDLPPGPIELLQGDLVTQVIEIVPRQFGFLEGEQLVNGQPLRLNRPATPTSVVTLEGTGLGRQPEYAEIYLLLSVGPRCIWSKGKARRDAVRAGIDVVEFEVPYGIEASCGLRADLWVEGTWSLQPVRLPAAARAGERCPESLPYDASDLDRLANQERVPAVMMALESSQARTLQGESWSTLELRAQVAGARIPQPSISLQEPGTCSLWRLNPFFLYEEIDFTPVTLGIPSIFDPLTGQGTSLGIAPPNADRNLRARLIDASGRTFFDSDPARPDGTRGPLPALPATGNWTVDTELGKWSFSPLRLERTGDPNAYPTLDRDYLVEWDTSTLQPGDRAHFTMDWWGDTHANYLACAADARTGAIRVPPALLREFARGEAGRSVPAVLRLIRQREVRPQPGSANARYFILQQQATDDREVILP